MKLRARKMVDVEVASIEYLITNENGEFVALMNPFEFKMFMTNCEKAWNMPVSTEVEEQPK